MIRKLIYLFLFILLSADLAYSFIQHINQPLDGDMAAGIVSNSVILPILESPIGLDAILYDRHYANPNKFFSHWSMKEYFLNIPLFLQRYTDPVNSVYLACAIFKIFIQLLLIYLISVAASGTFNILRMDFIISSVLITSFFQTNGYRSVMGIIDPCPTYNFFYSLPLAFLLILLLPLLLTYFHEKQWNAFIAIPYLFLSVIVTLSGPINPGVILVISLLVAVNEYINYRKERATNLIKHILVERKLLILILTPAAIMSVYSLYLGTYNIITIDAWIPLSEMYSRLLEGIFYQFFRKPGFPVLFIGIAINAIILRKKCNDHESQKLVSTLNWILIFSAVYIVLLPLGGYREYRSHILRYDTIMPVTIALIFYFTASTVYLLKHYRPFNKSYPVIPLIVFFVFTIADEPGFHKADREKKALHLISQSSEKVIQIEPDVKVLSWGNIERPEDSELNSQLLMIWNITNERKWYYNK
ncbi:MAG TPA: hypothetical protein VK172_09825 [Lentimicrobium sp.]|nr:hypothetical protein [Lentimicrobium sp.]